MPAPGRQPLLILLLWAAGLGAAGQFSKFSVILPEVAALYPERGASIGFLVSMVSFVGVVLGLSAGILLNRIGARQTLILSLLLGAAVSLFQSLLPAFSIMLGSRILEGLSHLGIVVAAPTLMSTLTSSRWQPLAMSLWGTFFGVSFALTAWLGIPLVREHGVDMLFLLHASHMAVMACLLGVLLPSAERAACNMAANGQQHPLRAGLQRHRQAYGSPFVAAPSCAWLFYAATFVALLTVLPTLMPASERALVAGIMPLAAIAVSMTLGVFLLRRVPAIRVIALGFTLAMALAIAFVVLPDTSWIAIALTGSLGLVQGASYAAIPQLNVRAEDQAIAYGTMAQMGNIGNIIGTPLLLAVLAAANLPIMMMTVVGLYLCAIMLQYLLSRARDRRLAAPTDHQPETH
ncbi:MFS transporter [Granulosicoccus sp. 3-233]|uniref:MFS transporter n=1 Tax=Granulosicoccus sp. 3-233 TaxID=3417969 RepID=UPI003D343FBD